MRGDEGEERRGGSGEGEGQDVQGGGGVLRATLID